MTPRHKSTAYVKALDTRCHWRKYDPITSQFRFSVRLAYACHQAHTEYDLAWQLADGRMAVTITAIGRIPDAKALPRVPKPKPIAPWKPAIWDAEYRLNAYHDANLKR